MARHDEAVAASGHDVTAPQSEAHARPRAAGQALAPLTSRPMVRLGVYAWALVGVVAVLYVTGRIADLLSLVVIPLVLALFPAAVLAPPCGWLKNRRVPPAAAALIVVLGALLILTGIGAALVPQIAAELDGLRQALQEGYTTFRDFLQEGAFGLPAVPLDELINRAQEQFAADNGGGLAEGALGAVVVVTEGLAGLILMLLALFFYLKDGERISRWLRDLFPERFRHDAGEIGVRAWHTIGGYIRGQLIIAIVDATLIGIGLFILRIPLALPLTVIVFFGGLFPIVGAVTAGTLAVLVALTESFTTALIVLALIVGVQQFEGHVLAPVILGRAVELHPLAALAALTGGAVLLGILGAFLAIPVTASVARAVGYLRQRAPG